MASLDGTMGDWYSAGFNGDFGSHDQGRFHSISDPMLSGPATVRYDIDCGRAEAGAVDDLLRRLDVLHSTHSIDAVLVGRGFIPGG